MSINVHFQQIVWIIKIDEIYRNHSSDQSLLPPVYQRVYVDVQILLRQMFRFLQDYVRQYLRVIVNPLHLKLTLKRVDHQLVLLHLHHLLNPLLNRVHPLALILQTLSRLHPADHTSLPLHHVAARSQSGRSARVPAERTAVAPLNLADNHLVVFFKLFVVNSAEILLMFLGVGPVVARTDVPELLVHERNAFSRQLALLFVFVTARLLRYAEIDEGRD